MKAVPKHLVRRVMEIDYRNKHHHAPGALSSLPIVYDIYSRMNLKSDKFILSNGHCCAALYAVLEEIGYCPKLTPHPERAPESGIMATTGSLGHGLPIAIGMALAKKIKGDAGKIYVLISDGESQEGATWEGVSLAAELKLENWLEIHVDCNGWQSDRAIPNSATHFALQAVFPVKFHYGPRGAGVSLYEQHPEWHGRHQSPEEHAQIMEELK